MECTQRLECTQELYDTHTERTCPEQIGFLGICGAKHPVLKGPNKVGRDPQTCSIILNLNSVSRQHAVINVLNSREFMLMDLDSANKTKLQNKTLQPYIPHRLKDGDTVQFGDIFGIFRLLEVDDELPMTQAIDIPETPAPSKPISKLHKAPTTLIPESPDVSDRDESFITPTQPNCGKSKLSNSQFIKPFSKTMSKLSLSSPKSDINRNSSNRSTSLSFIDNPNTSLNESFISLKSDKIANNNIFEMDTQPPNPIVNDSTDSIYTADTQIPPEREPSPSIHSLDTQLPTTEHLPQVKRIDDQHEMQFDICAANKENNQGNIFDAETQQFAYDKNDSAEIIVKNKSMSNKTFSESTTNDQSKENLNTSEEELLFDDVDDEDFEEDFHSQNLLPDELPLKEDAVKSINTEEKKSVPSKRDGRIQSDSSTDCEDIGMLPAQKISALPTEKNENLTKVETKTDQVTCPKITASIESDSSTDCEDTTMAPTQIIPELPIKNNTVQKKKKGDAISNTKPLQRLNRVQSDSSTDCEDIDLPPTQKVLELPIKKDTVPEKTCSKSKTKPSKRINRIKSDSSTDCEDIDMIPTQKIAETVVNKDDDETDCEDEVIDIKPNQCKNAGVTKFEDMPTQIIDVDHDKNDEIAFEDMPTQVIDVIDVATSSKNVPFEDQPTQIIETDVKKSFIEIISPFKIPLQSPKRVKSKDITKLTPKQKSTKSNPIESNDNYYNDTQDVYDDLCSQRESSPDILNNAPCADDVVAPCFVEDCKVDRELSPTKKQDSEKINSFISNLSIQEVKDIIGVKEQVSKLKRVPSDSSDVEYTPKKCRPFEFTDSDLPNSQEIKTSVMSHIRPAVTESSSESETENYSEDQTPFLHRKKKIKPVVKIDLTKKFDPQHLPDRVLTRQRKPTSRLNDTTTDDKQLHFLKPTYLVEQEDQIDGEIITENIKRIKTYHEAKTHKDSKSNESVKETKKESTSRNKTENNQNEPKEKIKVKIEKPKRKDTKSKSESSRKSDESSKAKSKGGSSDTTSVATVSTRRTRGKKNESDSKTTEKQSISPENNKKQTEHKRKRPNKVREKSKSPEVEVRRSKRQIKAKDKSGDDTTNAPKSILKKSVHEQSTVYDISSCSANSSRSLKRSLVNDSEVCSPKRTRSSANSTSNNITNASLRATPARVMKTQHVLFTAFPSDEVKHKLEKLGAVIVMDVLACTVVLTMQVKRTFKLLCAVGLGRPIVGPSWVQACADTHMIVDPWLYLIKDEPAEKRFQFNLERTLTGQRNFLKGYHVSSTPSVQPNASEMKLIVECSGGVWKEAGPNWVCVSCTKDKALWPALRKRGATVVSTEFILGGVLRQKLDIVSNTFP